MATTLEQLTSALVDYLNLAENASQVAPVVADVRHGEPEYAGAGFGFATGSNKILKRICYTK